MPLPTPTVKEEKNEFIARDAQQRIAVCIAQYEQK